MKTTKPNSALYASLSIGCLLCSECLFYQYARAYRQLHNTICKSDARVNPCTIRNIQRTTCPEFNASRILGKTSSWNSLMYVGTTPFSRCATLEQD
jgi:hypothetical protein